ncbi:hypothetical protein AYI69_g400 [Smittium culicis]|uniref:Uncharacterized protein n=1 Tax=Smittium culicis TaxID=133412 RepID=A0A1R1YT53_9FUNG|nr:hypothetical protein AYI69_g400 [Smittium culicis]
MNNLIRAGLSTFGCRNFAKFSFNSGAKCMYSSSNKDGVSKSGQNPSAETPSSSDKNTTIPKLSALKSTAESNLSSDSPIKGLFANSLNQTSKADNKPKGNFMDNYKNYVRAPNSGNSGMNSRIDKIRIMQNSFQDVNGTSFSKDYKNLSLQVESSIGRSIAVFSDNPVFALRKLQRIITQNKIRKILYLKKRYEKPFVKRARLAKEANAFRVKKQVREKVNMVLRMKGWGF